jgi:hypothetical protein
LKKGETGETSGSPFFNSSSPLQIDGDTGDEVTTGNGAITELDSHGGEVIIYAIQAAG